MTTILKPDEHEVRAQLGRILSSVDFRAAPVLSRMLAYIVEAALDGSAGRLNASVLAHEALGKAPDFQSSKDPSVRVAANRMRRALRLYYADQGRGDEVEILIRPGTYVPTIAYRADTKEEPSTRALRAVERYQSIATQQALSATLGVVEEALAVAPNNARLLASKADLLMDGHKHGFGDGLQALDIAHNLLERAREIDADDGHVRLASAFAALLDGDGSRVEALARDLADRGKDRKDRAFGIWALTLVSDEGASVCRSEPNLFDELDLPGWIHHAPFLAAYSEGDYETALSSAIEFGMPQFFWSGIDRAAALGQLGLRDAAQRELKRAKRQCSHLIKDLDIALRAYIPKEQVREHVIEGLSKANTQSVNPTFTWRC